MNYDFLQLVRVEGYFCPLKSEKTKIPLHLKKSYSGEYAKEIKKEREEESEK